MIEYILSLLCYSVKLYIPAVKFSVNAHWLQLKVFNKFEMMIDAALNFILTRQSTTAHYIENAQHIVIQL